MTYSPLGPNDLVVEVPDDIILRLHERAIRNRHTFDEEVHAILEREANRVWGVYGPQLRLPLAASTSEESPETR